MTASTLEAYLEKRDFSRTPEPDGSGESRPAGEAWFAMPPYGSTARSSMEGTR